MSPKVDEKAMMYSTSRKNRVIRENIPTIIRDRIDKRLPTAKSHYGQILKKTLKNIRDYLGISTEDRNNELSTSSTAWRGCYKICTLKKRQRTSCLRNICRNHMLPFEVNVTKTNRIMKKPTQT